MEYTNDVASERLGYLRHSLCHRISSPPFASRLPHACFSGTRRPFTPRRCAGERCTAGGTVPWYMRRARWCESRGHVATGVPTCLGFSTWMLCGAREVRSIDTYASRRWSCGEREGRSYWPCRCAPRSVCVLFEIKHTSPQLRLLPALGRLRRCILVHARITLAATGSVNRVLVVVQPSWSAHQ